MDIPDIPNVEVFTAAPAQTAFSFDFLIFEPTDLDVSVNGAPVTFASPALNATQYDVAFAAGVLGGTIYFGGPLTGGEEIIIQRSVPIRRDGEFQTTGPLNIAALNALLDRQTCVTQDLRQMAETAIKVYPGEEGITLPAIADRKGLFAFFDGVTGELIGRAVAEDVLALAGEEGAGLVGFKASGAGAVVRTAHAKLSDTVSVKDFGAVGDGVTDDLAAFNAAIASGATSIFVPFATYRLSAGITVPGGVSLYSDAFAPSNPTVGTTLLFDLAVATCVTLGGAGAGGNGLSSSFKGFIIKRAAGVRPAGCIGLRIERLYSVILEDVKAVGHTISYYFKADDTRGILAMMTRCYSGDVTDAHMVQDTWPEIRMSQCRFGQNGVGDSDAQCYIRVKGGSLANPAAGPNTLVATNCHFNHGNSKKVNQIIEFVEFTPGYISDIGVFKFNACHIESFLGGIKTDASIAALPRLGLTDVHFNSAVEFLQLDAGTTLTTWCITGCHFAGSFTLAQGDPVTAFQLTGNRFSGNVSLTSGDATSSLISSGNIYVGNLALAGAWQRLSINDNLIGTLNNLATGSWAVRLPGVDRRSWTPFISFATPGSAITYSKQAGVYEVVGNEVVCQFDIVLTAKGTGSGNAFLDGLPINVGGGANANSANGSGGQATYAVNMATVTGPVTFRTPSGAKADIFQGAAAGMARITAANMTDTTQLSGTIRYFR